MDKKNRMPAVLIQELLDRKDFPSLRNELPLMSRHIPTELAAESWDSLGEYYLERGEFVDFVLARNMRRVLGLYETEVISRFFQSIDMFVQHYKKEFAVKDVLLLEGVLDRITNFHIVTRPAKRRGTVSTGRVLQELEAIRIGAADLQEGPVSDKVNNLCFGLDQQMTPDEVRIEMARILMPGIIKVYENISKKEKNPEKGTTRTKKRRVRRRK